MNCQNGRILIGSQKDLAELLAAVQHEQGRLLGHMEALNRWIDTKVGVLPGMVGKGLDTAFAQDHVVVSAGQNVFCGDPWASMDSLIFDWAA